MKLQYVSFLAIFIFVACSQPKNNKIIEIDVKQAFKQVQEFDLAVQGKNCKRIQLESNQECLLGELKKVIKKGEFIFVADFNSNLFMFDKEGQFVRKIGNVGKGKGEYLMLCDFDVDEQKQEIYINMLGRLAVYSYGNEYLRTIDMGDPSLQVFCVNTDEQICALYPDRSSKEDSLEVLKIFDKDANVVNTISAHTDRETGLPFFCFLSKKDHMVYYKRELDPFVYALSENNRVKAVMKLDFKDLAFTAALYSTSAMDQWKKHYRLYGMNLIDNWIVFHIQNGLMDNNITPLLYSKKEQKYFIPCNNKREKGLFFKNMAVDVLCNDENVIVGLLDADDVTENSNPVLLQWEM